MLNSLQYKWLVIIKKSSSYKKNFLNVYNFCFEKKKINSMILIKQKMRGELAESEKLRRIFRLNRGVKKNIIDAIVR